MKIRKNDDLLGLPSVRVIGTAWLLHVTTPGYLARIPGPLALTLTPFA